MPIRIGVLLRTWLLVCLFSLGTPGRGIASWVAPFRGPNTLASEAIYQMKSVSLARTADDVVHAVFVDRDGALTSNVDRVKFVEAGQAPVVLASGSSLGNFADVASARDGSLHVVYRNVVASHPTILYRSRTGSTAWTTEIALATGQGTDDVMAPRIAIDSLGHWRVTYTEFGPSGYAIRYLQQGGTPQTVAPLTGPGWADLALAPDQSVHAVYAQLVLAQGVSALVHLSCSPSGSWSAPETLLKVPMASFISDPRVAIDGSGALHIVFTQSRGSFAVLDYFGRGIGPHPLSTDLDTLGFYCGLDVSADGRAYVCQSRTALSSGLGMRGFATDAQATRSLEYVYQCVSKDAKVKSYPVPGLDCACWSGPGHCPTSVGSITDAYGQTARIQCLGYFCFDFVPSPGAASLMVGKCAWWGASNYWEVIGIPGSDPATPRQILRTHQVNMDWFGPAAAYCDDYHPGIPCTDGYYDWLDEEYRVCENRLTISHWGSTTMAAKKDRLFPSYEGRPAATCDLDAFVPKHDELANHCKGYPAGFDGNCDRLSNAPVSAAVRTAVTAADTAMLGSTVTLVVTGTPQGGSFTLRIGDSSVALSTLPGEAVTAVAAGLRDAVNNSAELAAAGVHATSSLDALTLTNALESRVSASISDPGIYQPPAPTNFHATLRDTVTNAAERHIDLAWTNPVTYDRIGITKAGGVFLPSADGESTRATDTDPWSLPQEYGLVGWKSGMPSRAAGLDAAADVSPMRRGTSSGWCIGVPNPFRSGVMLHFGVSVAGPARLDLFDAQGRRVRSLEWSSAGVGTREILWDGRDDHGRPVPAGIYFCRVTAPRVDLEGRVIKIR